MRRRCRRQRGQPRQPRSAAPCTLTVSAEEGRTKLVPVFSFLRHPCALGCGSSGSATASCKPPLSVPRPPEADSTDGCLWLHGWLVLIIRAMGELRWDGHSCRSGRFRCASHSRIWLGRLRSPLCSGHLRTLPGWPGPLCLSNSYTQPPVGSRVGAYGRDSSGGAVGQQCRAGRVGWSF